MKSGDIVVYKDTIGTAVTAVGEKDVLRFLPCNHRICSFSSLDIITEEVAREATHDEKIKLITEEYVWGEVVKVHCIGEYQIVEAIGKKDKKVHWHGYINYKDINVTYDSLDCALVGCIGIKHEGRNGRAAMYFYRMINMQQSSEDV